MRSSPQACPAAKRDDYYRRHRVAHRHTRGAVRRPAAERQLQSRGPGSPNTFRHALATGRPKSCPDEYARGKTRAGRHSPPPLDRQGLPSPPDEELEGNDTPEVLLSVWI